MFNILIQSIAFYFSIGKKKLLISHAEIGNSIQHLFFKNFT